jgi:hypothetical protein
VNRQGRATKNRPLVCALSVAMVLSLCSNTTTASTVVYETASYYAPVDAVLAGMGPDSSSTVGAIFVASEGASVALNDFSFYAQSYYGGTGYGGGVATLYIQPFVCAWSGNMTGHGAGAVGHQPPPWCGMRSTRRAFQDLYVRRGIEQQFKRNQPPRRWSGLPVGANRPLLDT